MRPHLAFAILASLASLTACEDDKTGGALLPTLGVTAIAPKVLVPGTELTVAGVGFVTPEVADLLVVVRGAIDGDPVEFAVVPDRQDDETLTVRITGQVAQALIRPGGRFVGRISVSRTPKATTAAGAAEEAGKDFELKTEVVLTPSIGSIAPTELYVGDTITFSGDGFLYPNEGASLVELTGTMTTELPSRFIPIEGLVVPGVPVEADNDLQTGREAMVVTLTPDVLGIVPGTFQGSVRIVNTALDGTVTASTPIPVSFPLKPPYIDSVSPNAASRGQWIRVTGRGFTPPDGLLQAATVMFLEGEFEFRSGGTLPINGPTTIVLMPDFQPDNRNMSAILRVELDASGRPSGLGLLPGTFRGKIGPALLLGGDLVKGTGVETTFEILPQRQIIYLRALPSFDDALEEFGLLAEKDAIKQRVLEVVTRDYQGVNIAFTWDEPKDYAEYGIIELAGRDPNGTGLFGLDNTEGKDVGNLRFNDIIGGYNADTSASGYSAYGGIFPGEFLNMSTRRGDNPLASPRFDDIFEPVVPVLGGKAAQAGESAGDSQRAADIREAVRVFGNLVGSTVSHEAGHSLGLANVDGQFHNIGDNPGWLMDAGSYRPFEERAELDGQGPSFFEPESLDYLKSILPLE
jgi:hypothetical protein